MTCHRHGLLAELINHLTKITNNLYFEYPLVFNKDVYCITVDLEDSLDMVCVRKKVSFTSSLSFWILDTLMGDSGSYNTRSIRIYIYFFFSSFSFIAQFRFH